MANTETDITGLTYHVQWPALAAVILALEKQETDRLRSAVDPVANQRLIFLANLKAHIAKRSENKDLWNV